MLNHAKPFMLNHAKPFIIINIHNNLGLPIVKLVSQNKVQFSAFIL